jgi:hypothetical protein
MAAVEFVDAAMAEPTGEVDVPATDEVVAELGEGRGYTSTRPEER